MKLTMMDTQLCMVSSILALTVKIKTNKRKFLLKSLDVMEICNSENSMPDLIFGDKNLYGQTTGWCFVL